MKILRSSYRKQAEWLRQDNDQKRAIIRSLGAKLEEAQKQVQELRKELQLRTEERERAVTASTQILEKYQEVMTAYEELQEQHGLLCDAYEHSEACRKKVVHERDWLKQQKEEVIA